MSDYSPEPSRKHCVVHHTFDFVEGDKVVDLSPQKHDGSLVGDVELGHTGVVGQAAKLADEEADVLVDAATTHYPAPSTVVSGWSKSERPVPTSEDNVQASLTISGTNYQLSHSVSEDVAAWQFAAVEYDGTDARLYYARLGEELTVVDTITSIGGDVEDALLEFNTEGHGFIDDARMYRRSLGRPHIQGLYSIGSEHNSTDELGEAWDNNGIPFRGTNAEFAGSLGEEKDQILRQLDYIREARHVDDAAGEQLDRIGSVAGVRRREGEVDAKYRARIKGRVAAGRSRGTFEDILEATASVVDTTIDRVEIQENFDSDPATAFVYVRAADLEESPLTASDVTAILKDVVLAGHDIQVTEQGATPFTVINDTMANDPKEGLTSDSISTGGGLVSDV